jgi:hypothetical protein
MESGTMPKRPVKKRAKAAKRPRVADELGKALAGKSKTQLVNVIVEFARADRTIMRRLQSAFGVETPSSELIASARQAIAEATYFDEREVNRNFRYDYEAYEAVQTNFGRLIRMQRLCDAMDLSLELMSQGSYQVEMSDEGLMTEEIEECLRVVINALKKSDLAAGEVNDWCAAMTKKDRVGFICDKELRALQAKFSVASARGK